MNKKVFLCTYYAGLILGVIVANYLLWNYAEIGEELINEFQGMDKLKYIDGKELFLYLFLKRSRQLVITGLVFFQISQIITLLVSDFYYAVIEGIFLSLCTHYYGMTGIIGGSCLLVPQFLYFILIQWMGWKLYKNRDTKQKTRRIYVLISLWIVLTVITLIEMMINFWIGPRIFL